MDARSWACMGMTFLVLTSLSFAVRLLQIMGKNESRQPQELAVRTSLAWRLAYCQGQCCQLTFRVVSAVDLLRLADFLSLAHL